MTSSPRERNPQPIGVGIVGLGRSGWNIHASTLRQLPDTFRVVAVSDPVEARRDEAKQTFDCRTYDTFPTLIADDDVELVVIASPNHLHTQHAIEAMRLGKNVVCEKPFALSVDDADRMIEAAQQTGRVLAPFQNRRYEPHFQTVRDLIEAGTFGQVVQVRMTWQQFTRRWDWQTLSRFGGGLLNNNGSHLLDHALQLVHEHAELDLFTDLRRVLSLGDTEDHVKITLTGKNLPTIDVELTNSCAYPQDRWLVMGSAGGLRGTMDRLEWKTVDWSQMPSRSVEVDAAPGRTYNNEDIPWKTFTWERPDVPKDYEYLCFYRDLYATIRRNKPLFITPQSVRRLIAVQERCYGHNTQLV